MHFLAEFSKLLLQNKFVSKQINQYCCCIYADGSNLNWCHCQR